MRRRYCNASEHYPLSYFFALAARHRSERPASSTLAPGTPQASRPNSNRPGYTQQPRGELRSLIWYPAALLLESSLFLRLWSQSREEWKKTRRKESGGNKGEAASKRSRLQRGEWGASDSTRARGLMVLVSLACRSSCATSPWPPRRHWSRALPPPPVARPANELGNGLQRPRGPGWADAYGTGREILLRRRPCFRWVKRSLTPKTRKIRQNHPRAWLALQQSPAVQHEVRRFSHTVGTWLIERSVIGSNSVFRCSVPADPPTLRCIYSSPSTGQRPSACPRKRPT